MKITLSASSVKRALFIAMAVVVAAGLTVEILNDIYSWRGRHLAVQLFSLSYEQNIPTWYSSAILLACSALLALIAVGTKREGEKFVRHWWGLSAAFLYISIDETASIHELGSALFKFHGVFYYGWIIPAAAIVAALGLAYIRFLLYLPKTTRVRFVVAGAIYVFGALVMELPLGYWADKNGSQNLGYALIDAVEEAMEILGATLFLLALLHVIKARGYRLVFNERADEAE